MQKERSFNFIDWCAEDFITATPFLAYIVKLRREFVGRTICFMHVLGYIFNKDGIDDDPHLPEQWLELDEPIILSFGGNCLDICFHDYSHAKVGINSLSMKEKSYQTGTNIWRDVSSYFPFIVGQELEDIQLSQSSEGFFDSVFYGKKDRPDGGDYFHTLSLIFKNGYMLQLLGSNEYMHVHMLQNDMQGITGRFKMNETREPHVSLVTFKNNQFTLWKTDVEQYSYVVSIDLFYDGLAVVKTTDGRYGYVNEWLDFIIPPQYAQAEPFCEGLARVVKRECNGTRCCMLDRQGVELELCASDGQQYRGICDASNGMIRIAMLVLKSGDLAYHSDHMENAGIWGYADISGQTIIQPQYIYAYDFQNNRAIVCKGRWSRDEKWNNQYNTGLLWTENALWGVIDRTGAEVIPCIYDEIRQFTDSQYFMVHTGGRKEGKWGVMDQNGEWAAPSVFEDLDGEMSQDGCFAFYSADKWSEPGQVQTGVYSITEQRILIEPAYYELAVLANGTFKVMISDPFSDKLITQILGKDGIPLFASGYTFVYPRPGGYEVAIQEKGQPDSHGALDKSGNVLLPCEPETQFWGTSIPHKRFVFSRGRKQGLMDFNHKVVIPAFYDRLSIMQDGLVLVT